MLKARIATATVGLPILILLVFVGGWPLTLIAALAIGIASYEYLRVARMAPAGIVIGAIGAAAQVLAAPGGEPWRQALLIAGVVVPSLWPVVAGRAETALADWSFLTLGVLYYGWLGSYAVLLRDQPDGRDWLLLGLLAAMATDTGAYAVGRLFGQHRLAPRISPHKTWEGAAGGLAAGFIVVVLFPKLAILPLSAASTIMLGLALPIVAEFGDLAKSAIKRSLNVKDFGRIVVGHGGVADRIDSWLFVLPVLYVWIRWDVL